MLCKQIVICSIIVTYSHLRISLSLQFFCIPFASTSAHQKYCFFTYRWSGNPAIISLSFVLYFPPCFIIMSAWSTSDFDKKPVFFRGKLPCLFIQTYCYFSI